MRFGIISFFALVFILLSNVAQTHAQSTKKNSADSVKAARAHTDSVAKAKKSALENAAKARKRALDSTKAAREYKMDSATNARKHKTDSLTQARKHKTDSTAKARKRVTDSTARVRKYKESKKYKDSVTRSKAAKTKAIQSAREARMDSLQEARKKSTDSLTTARKTRTDSIKTVQKHRSDSLAKLKKYKESKRYTDSVTLTRRQRSDSIKAVQKEFRDSIAAVRMRSLDSAKTARAHTLDSTKKSRAKYMDSIKLVRKARTDSLEKKKANKEKLVKAKEKKKMEDLKLKIDLKQKKEREAWSNKTMLKKRWGPIRRLTQNSFTHYNYYYNANRKMEEAEQNMRRVNKENYDSLIGLFPFDPNKDSTLLAADMDSIVHKLSVGIQIHDPRVKWSDDMYLLLGEAYYYKGNYENASIAFRYIIAGNQKKKNKKGKGYSRSGSTASIVEKKKKSKLAFLKHKSVNNEAILWLARTYTSAGQVENAESILSLLEYDPNLPNNLKGRLAVEKAFAFLKLRNYEEASKQLSIAVNDENLPAYLRLRIAFLNGQLKMNTGDYLAASKSFEEVLEHHPKIDMDFYTRKYIAYNKLMAGQEVADAMVPLKRMLNDGKYANYYDEVYYVLGMLANKANKNGDAINYFVKSTKTPKASKKQKAISFAALGDVYYATSNYSYAKIAYDSAAKYASGSKDKTVTAAVQRSAGLKEISGPAGVIHDMDSLLELSALSKKDQQAFVKRHIRDLEKKREDSIFKAESASTTTVEALETVSDRPGGAGATSWYFSNPAMVSQGSADFKRKWGTRVLADNWRRAAAAPLAGSGKAGSSGSASGEDGEDEEDGVVMENGLPSAESLLAKIPNTQQQKDLNAKITQKSYILLAQAYVKQLEDYNQALHTLDTLNTRFPAHTQKEEELFLRYQIAIRQNKLDKAQEYSAELLAKFPRSQYASMLRPANSESKPTNENVSEVSAYFDETYSLLMRHQYTEAQMRSDIAKKKFDHPVYKKRFEVTEAMAYAGAGNYDMADTAISKFLKENPSDSLTPWARTVKAYINDVRNGGKPSWYKEGPSPGSVADAKKAAAKPAATPEADEPPPPPLPEIPKVFAFQTDSPHYCILVLPGLDSRTGTLKRSLNAFGADKYPAAGLELLIDMYSMSQGVVIVKNFANAAQARDYMNNLINSAALGNYKPGELNMYVISAQNYKKMFADKTAADYASFYSTYYNK